MSALPQRRMNAAEFLAWERANSEKHEFIDGEIIDFAGTSVNHAQIVHNLHGSFYNQLRRGQCRTYSTDIRLRVGKAKAYTYPDLVIACGELQFVDDQHDTLLNPALIIEVLSPSTITIDRVKKFQLYTSLPSLQEYLLIAQDSAVIEQYQRQSDGSWRYLRTTNMPTEVTLPSINASLPLTDVYEYVDLPAADPSDDADGLV